MEGQGNREESLSYVWSARQEAGTVFVETT